MFLVPDFQGFRIPNVASGLTYFKDTKEAQAGKSREAFSRASVLERSEVRTASKAKDLKDLLT